MIQSVNSNTSLTLDKPFAETTVSNSNYRILLNTAAHFPSDTAAKVERALEQLSDINEAAINNNRTVTAATKVNGKGLSSTMGDLHLNPASINTNRGGTINFHYNQASSVTSAIYENASGQVRIDGNLYLNGNTTNGLKVKGGSLEAYTHTDTTANQTRDIIVYGPDGTSRISTLRNKYYTNGNKELEIFISQDVDGSTVFNSLIMTNDTEGNRRCFLKYSPATTSNSTDIATTAYVKSNLASYLPLSGSSPITGTIMKDTTHVRGGTDVYAAKDTIPLLVRDGNGKNWFRLITSQKYTSSSDFYSSVGFYLYHPINASQNGNVANIAVGYNQDGAYAQAPTPAASDNSTKIATTAFVNNRLPYTSGTWTPTCYGATTAGSTTISGNKCQYVKIGKLVILNVAFTFTVNTAPAGQVRIGGLPFSADKNAYGMFWCSGHPGFIFTVSSSVLYVRAISNNIPYLIGWGTSTWDNTVDSTGSVEGSIVYFTA